MPKSIIKHLTNYFKYSFFKVPINATLFIVKNNSFRIYGDFKKSKEKRKMFLPLCLV